MNQSADGWIVYNNVSYSKGLHRFTEKNVRRWIEDQVARGGSLEYESGPWYRVAFERHGESKVVDCRIELRSSQRVWIGGESASSPDAAVTRTLHRLLPVMSPMQMPGWTQTETPLTNAG